jgi:hypothetical protein
MATSYAPTASILLFITMLSIPIQTVAQYTGQYAQPSSNAYAQCMNAASRQSGYQGNASYPNGGAVEGAARGALWGSWVGGWSGNAGEGAGWGAAAGAVVGASRRRRAEKAQDQARNNYNQAFEQCMQYSAARSQPAPQPMSPQTVPPATQPTAPPVGRQRRRPTGASLCYAYGLRWICPLGS